VFADPGEFEFYSCEQLLPQRNALVTRAHDLKLLMDKAEQSTGGAIVNVIAYEADYVTAREQVKVIEETARLRNAIFRTIRKAMQPSDDRGWSVVSATRLMTPLPTRPTAPELGEPHRPHPGMGR
jgi:hypothetical protein